MGAALFFVVGPSLSRRTRCARLWDWGLATCRFLSVFLFSSLLKELSLRRSWRYFLYFLSRLSCSTWTSGHRRLQCRDYELRHDLDIIIVDFVWLCWRLVSTGVKDLLFGLRYVQSQIVFENHAVKWSFMYFLFGHVWLFTDPIIEVSLAYLMMRQFYSVGITSSNWSRRVHV